MVSPKVSTMGSLFTMALFCTILITPSASVTVTTMGSPSGMAATARLEETAGFDKQNHQTTSPGPAEPETGRYLTPMVNMSRILFPCSQPTSMITPETQVAAGLKEGTPLSQ